MGNKKVHFQYFRGGGGWGDGGEELRKIDLERERKKSRWMGGERGTGRQASRQADRQVGWEADIWTDRQTGRLGGRQAGRQAGKQTDWRERERTGPK